MNEDKINHNENEPETVFHKIARGDAPAHVIWENDNFLAFLSIYPNTEGATVVIPKEWQPSYFREVSKSIRNNFMDAVSEVAKLLDEKLDDVGRTAVVFEGLGVNYLHAKLFPLHGTGDIATDGWRHIDSGKKMDDVYFETYEGYISSHSAARAEDSELKKVAKKIRE